MQIRIHLKISIRLLTDGLGGLLHWLAQKSGLLVFQAAVDVVDCWPGFALHIGGEFATLQIVKLLQDHPRDEQSGEPKRCEWVLKYFVEIKQKKKKTALQSCITSYFKSMHTEFLFWERNWKGTTKSFFLSYQQGHVSWSSSQTPDGWAAHLYQGR